MTDDTELQIRIDEIVDQFLASRNAGNAPSIENLVSQYPDIEGPLRDTLKTVLFVDDLKAANETSALVGVHGEVMPVISDFRIVRKIGQGGMGVVFEAEQESLGRRVALKILPPHISNNQKFTQRFRREARAAAKLHHTNIVPVFEVGQEGDTLFYAMQFIDGQPLDEVIKEVKRLKSVEGRSNTNSISGWLSDSGLDRSGSTGVRHLSYFKSVARLGAAVADALEYAHQRSIIHRDVKPSNLILDQKGVIWLADFGLAGTSESELTETGDFLGTARYMAPERFKGPGDHLGDIYGLGITLYELATLSRAFKPEDRLQLIDQIANLDPQKPSEIDRHIPLDLETIILKSMNKDPRRRYQSANQMAADLQRFVDGRPVQARRASIVERTIRWMLRHKAQTAAMASMLIAIVALIVGTLSTLHQRNIAVANEALAKEETTRADAAAKRASRSASVTVEALAGLVDSVREEMRNYPELLDLKQQILKNAESKLTAVLELADDSDEVVALKVQALITLARLNYEVGKYAECDSQYNRALESVNQLEQRVGRSQSVFQARSSCFLGLGSMAFKKHDQNESRKYFQLAFDNNKAWSEFDAEHNQATLALASAADNLADSYVLLNERDWDKAEKYHQQALELRERLKATMENNYELNYAYAASHMKLGDMYYGRASIPGAVQKEVKGNFQTAQAWFRKSLELLKRLVKGFPDDRVKSLRLQAAIYERIADTCIGDEANQQYLLSIAIKDQLAPKLAFDRNFQRDRAISWGRIALNQFEGGAKDTAVESMNRCLTILEETLVRIPQDAGLKIDVMITLFQLGMISADPEKKDLLQKSVAIGEELIQEGKIAKDFDLYLKIKDALKRLNEKSVD
ncbi:MAG: serine/threonine-protein kinase [Planctomycetota bacterium]